MSQDFKIETLSDLKYWSATTMRCIQTCLITGLLKPYVDCVCGNNMRISQKYKTKYRLDDGFCYWCKSCGKTKSLRNNSIFAGSNKSLSCWIDLIFTFSLDEDVGTASKLSGYHRKRGGQLFKKFRKCCGKYLNDNFEQLGEDWVIEIDESAFSKQQKYNQGAHRGDTRWVFGMVERSTGRCKFVYVPSRTREVLLPIIQQYIGAGATVYSDMWRSYWVLGSEGYIHRMVNHAEAFVDRDTEVHTNTIEGVWKWAKAAVQKAGGCKDDDLQHKLDEFAFRKTYLKDSATNFTTVAQLIASYWQDV